MPTNPEQYQPSTLRLSATRLRDNLSKIISAMQERDLKVIVTHFGEAVGELEGLSKSLKESASRTITKARTGFHALVREAREEIEIKKRGKPAAKYTPKPRQPKPEQGNLFDGKGKK